MISQYPYTLQVLSITGETQDGDGNWIPGTPSWAFLSYCRDEAGSGKEVVGEDGNSHVSTAIIFLPKGTPAVAAGTRVRVLNGDIVRLEDEVVYSRQDQLHSRIWV